jgi:hypothetical protein
MMTRQPRSPAETEPSGKEAATGGERRACPRSSARTAMQGRVVPATASVSFIADDPSHPRSTADQASPNSERITSTTTTSPTR